MGRMFVWGVAGIFAASGACSLVTDLSSLGADASVDVAIEAPSDGFVLTAKPAHVTLDPQDSIDIEIDIARGGAFADIIDVTVNDVGGLSGIKTTPSTVTFTASAPVKLHLDVDLNAKTPQDGTITLLGIGRSTQKSQQTSFGVRVGSVLVDTQANVKIPVPAYASSLWIKAWGAGGGAGASTVIYSANNTLAVGGFGGGGGLAGAQFATPQGSILDIVVGAAGTTYIGGGSGGGYTSVALGTTTLLLAGGGGGGGEGHSDSVYCNQVLNGGNAYAGGGANAQASPRSATTTGPGAAGDSNAGTGASYAGGNGSLPVNSCKFGCADGGAPGGGRAGGYGSCANGGGGGGGGGFFGGGGGGVGQGAGGGSGFVSDAGADVIQAAGSYSAAAASTDGDYRAGTATGGAASTDNTPAVLATPGRVIVRLPKP